MATKVTMEALSPTMEEGRLVKWTKNEGDAVKTGDVLAEVETDKAVMELVARGDGVLRKRLANEGDASPVGTLLAVIGAADENIDAIVGAAAPAAASTPAASAPAAQAPAAQAAPAQGAQKTSVPPTPQQSQGEASAPPQQKAAPPTTAAPPRPAGPPAQKGNGSRPGAPAAPGSRPRSSPLARRLASDKGIQLGGIQGSGPGGRIV
ncbi:MAG TPA: biotin/lipoyl-containing protein, partial [Gemmatimonadaceae bacterium]|nr:biotin/lipoyl-containing protein [Gemmatimonadaceae bacterium]